VFYLLPRELRACFVAVVLALAIFLCIPVYHGSTSWISVALTYGSSKFPLMGNPGQSSLAMILATRFGFTYDSVVSVPLGWMNAEVKLRTLLRAGFVVGLLLCCAAAAIQGWRKNPRFLVALITPWILMFALLPQMNNRYLFWGAALTALMPAVGAGMTLLGVVLSLICWSMMVQIMYFWNPGADLTAWAFRLTNPLHPDLGWVVVLIAGIYLYVALTRGRGGKEEVGVEPDPPSSGGFGSCRTKVGVEQWRRSLHADPPRHAVGVEPDPPGEEVGVEPDPPAGHESGPSLARARAAAIFERT
jgi:hypothetical protein